MESFVTKSTNKEKTNLNMTVNEHNPCADVKTTTVTPPGLTQSLVYLVLVFSLAVLGLSLVYLNFPQLDPAEVQHIRLPNNLEQARNLGLVLSRYTGDHFYTVFSGFVVIYIFLQTFAIPGSIFLSILSGYLFPQALALFLVCLCSATGASCCYLISQMVGRPLVNRFWPEKAASWSAEADKHRENFLSYMLFLRVTPFLPNWFINIASPIIDIPLTPFFIGTFFGVAPPSFLAIQTGTTLHDISLAAGSFSWSSFLVIGISAAVVLAPILFKNYFKSKME